MKMGFSELLKAALKHEPLPVGPDERELASTPDALLF
jgi:hypothetical protein